MSFHEQEGNKDRAIRLQVNGLQAGYGRHVVLQDLELELRSGTIMTLIGPNGAGKSTLLKTLIRQLEPLGGTVLLDGKDVFQMDAGELARRMSIVMTERVKPELLTCRDIVSYGRYPYTGRMGRLTEEDQKKVQDAMELADISELADRYFTEISDGQRQRVMLARAICQEPEILILDEPLSFLDIRYKLAWLKTLKRLAMEKGVAVLMTLHELDLAQKIADWAICVKNGRIVFAGGPEEVFTKERIEELYDLNEIEGLSADCGGSYLPTFGSLELPRQDGAPEVFVIGGAGSGIPVYRQLWREGICFAAGVLSAGDLDYPVAEALASAVIACPAFEPVPAEAAEEAMAVLETCRRVICTLDPEEGFGSGNAGNRQLLERARERGIPVEFR